MAQDDKREERHCRVCGIVLFGKDWHMGVCHQCIVDTSRQTVKIKSPGYGFRGDAR